MPRRRCYLGSGAGGPRTGRMPPPRYARAQNWICHGAPEGACRESKMSKGNMEDGIADAVAATALISVVLVTLIVWLSGLPS